MKPWTLHQQRRYRALVAELRRLAPFDEDSRRAVIADVCGATSTADIGQGQMRDLIREMERLVRAHGGRVITKRRPPAPSANGTRHTRKQFGKIMGLAQNLGWSAPRLQGFVRRTLRGWDKPVSALTQDEASRVISGLEAEIRSIAAGTARADRPERRVGAPPHPRFIPGGLVEKK